MNTHTGKPPRTGLGRMVRTALALCLTFILAVSFTACGRNDGPAEPDPSAPARTDTAPDAASEGHSPAPADPEMPQDSAGTADSASEVSKTADDGNLFSGTISDTDVPSETADGANVTLETTGGTAMTFEPTGDANVASETTGNGKVTSETTGGTAMTSETTGAVGAAVGPDEEREEEEKMKIQVTDGTHTVIFALNNSPAARSLYGQLPLTTDVEDYSDNEKIFYPEKLDTSEAVDADAKKGTLAYFSPWGDVVMYYKDFGSYSGLYELGQAVSGPDEIESLSGTIDIPAVE